MPRNIEIKVRVDDLGPPLARARELGGTAPVQTLEQDDTFYAVTGGRLKLRRFGDGSAELIHYQRDDRPEARASDYVRVVVADADGLHQALARGCGVRGRVRKRRWLVLHAAGDHATRLHFDRVEGLGDFVELEVVLGPGQDDAAAMQHAEALLRSLGLDDAPRTAGAYVDLLAPAGR